MPLDPTSKLFLSLGMLPSAPAEPAALPFLASDPRLFVESNPEEPLALARSARRAIGDTARRRAPERGARAPDGAVAAASLQQADNARRARPKPYDGSHDAAALHEAMHGGITGWGTDEAAIFKTLEGKSPEQIRAIRASYQDHYGKDLDAELKGELSGADLQRAEASMRGDARGADADALFQAIDGAGTDEAAIFKTLEGKTPDQLRAIESKYQERHGRELRDDLRGDLSGDELKRAEALLDGDKTAADVATLHDAIAGAGTDEAAIFATLEGKSKGERAAIERGYRERYGVSLREDLAGDLSGTDLDRAKALLDGNSARADAAKIRASVEGLGTDEATIQRTLDGKDAAQRAAISAEYKRLYGVELRRDLRDDMSGNDLERTEKLLDHGSLTDAEKLHYAIDGVGTDEQAIHEVLRGKSREQIEQLRAEYHAQYGGVLDADLAGDLSGREAFDARQELKGKPRTAEEALERANERRAFERTGGLARPGNFLMGLTNDKGELLDRNTARANDYYKQAMADGVLDASERARLDQLTGYVDEDVESYRSAKDSIANTAGTIAATAAAVGVSLASLGTATPLLVTCYSAACAGAGARLIVTTAIDGNSAGWESLAQNTLTGAVEGGFGVVGAASGSGKAVSGALIRSAARSSVARAGIVESEEALQVAGRHVLGRAANRLAFGAAEGATDGAISSGLSHGARAAVTEDTWRDGAGAGLLHVMKSGAGGVVQGTAGGAAMGGTLSAFRKAPAYQGTPMRPKYAGEETGAVWGSKIKYLSDTEREAYRITIRDGKVYDASGKLYDTTPQGPFASNDNAIFVMGKDGELYAATQPSLGGLHHSSFLAGSEVAYAGEMAVKKGVITALSNRSVHYMPTEAITRQGLRVLAHDGVDLSHVPLRLWQGPLTDAGAYARAGAGGNP